MNVNSVMFDHLHQGNTILQAVNHTIDETGHAPYNCGEIFPIWKDVTTLHEVKNIQSHILGDKNMKLHGLYHGDADSSHWIKVLD